MRLIYLLLAGLALAAALPAATQDLPPPIPILKLTNGRVLHQVQIQATLHDHVMVLCTEGEATVPYEQFPDDLRKKLEAIRPVSDLKTVVREVDETGRVVTLTQAPAIATGPSAPSGPASLWYPGRVFLPGNSAAGIPLPDVLVYAVKPADFAAYEQARQKKYGAAIDAAADKMLDAKGDAQKEAVADTRLTIYASFEPAPPAIAVVATDDKGHFNLPCQLPEVVLVVRATAQVGDSFLYMVWARLAKAGDPILLTTTNVVVP